MDSRRIRLLTGAGVLALMALIVGTAIALSGRNVSGDLEGYQEVPAVSTVAAGDFEARTARSEDAIDYELSYRDLEGDVTQAHIHFAQRDVNGGISVWLCSNLPSPPTPPGVQACPSDSATVTGTIEADDVVGPSSQGIAAGELDELLRAIRNGVAYANVHSTKFPGGEVRAHLRPGGSGD